MTLRLSPVPGEAPRLRAWLSHKVDALATRVGLVAASLLETDAPQNKPTAEERLRGTDSMADWAVLLSGRDFTVLDSVRRLELSEAQLVENGAAPGVVADNYQLAHVLTPQDL